MSELPNLNKLRSLNNHNWLVTLLLATSLVLAACGAKVNATQLPNKGFSATPTTLPTHNNEMKINIPPEGPQIRVIDQMAEYDLSPKAFEQLMAAAVSHAYDLYMKQFGVDAIMSYYSESSVDGISPLFAVEGMNISLQPALVLYDQATMILTDSPHDAVDQYIQLQQRDEAHQLINNGQSVFTFYNMGDPAIEGDSTATAIVGSDYVGDVPPNTPVDANIGASVVTEACNLTFNIGWEASGLADQFDAQTNSAWDYVANNKPTVLEDQFNAFVRSEAELLRLNLKIGAQELGCNALGVWYLLDQMEQRGLPVAQYKQAPFLFPVGGFEGKINLSNMAGFFPDNAPSIVIKTP